MRMKTQVGGDGGGKRARKKKTDLGSVVNESAEEAGSNAESSGKLKRSKFAADNGRYGSAQPMISDAMLIARSSVSDCQRALNILGQDKSSVVGGLCEGGGQKRPGDTPEQALEIGDDDDDEGLEILAITLRPLLAQKQMFLDNDSGKFLKEGVLSAEDITAHQKGRKITLPADHQGAAVMEIVDNKPMTCGVEADFEPGPLTPQDVHDFKKKASLGGEVAIQSSGKVQGGNVEKEDEEDEEEDIFRGSPRRRKVREVVFAESDDEWPDREVEDDSESDRESTPEPEDPFAEVWRDYAIMARQIKSQEDADELFTGCQHTFELINDVGRACSQCGLIKEDIKDMSFLWRRPRLVRKAWTRGTRLESCNGGYDLVEEEERLTGMPQLEVHPSLEVSMHPHQLEGFKFLSRNLVEEDSGGCMLAFAPGTGKSFLVISFIQSFLVKVPGARPMIVAPKSMLRPWMQEFKKWEVEKILVLNLYEAEDQIQMLKQWQETKSVLLVGYSQCTNMNGDIGRFLTEGPGLLILDEGHLARTESTKILQSLSKVHTKRRVLLSGTPFNNNFEEFYTTLDLVRPNFMLRANALMCPTLDDLAKPELPLAIASSPLPKKSSSAGRQAFKDVIGEKFDVGKHANITRALQQLRELIEPFVAWHKGQILDTLPGISDFTIMLDLTTTQRELLKNESVIKDNLQKRAAAIYVHPILEPVAEHCRRTENDPRLKGDIDVRHGVKLRWVLDLVQLCDDAGEKVLIFSEYLYSLALIENMASQKMNWSKGSQILRMDGKLPPQEREKIVSRFNMDPKVKMLCASIKACGEGISLVGASRVVLLEVLWNPAVSRQAISRAFRIGQQKKVFVYRLVAADTYEEIKMHAAATRKEWLSKLLFDPTISCEDPNSILWDVTGKCSDRFFDRGPLLQGVNRIYEREF